MAEWFSNGGPVMWPILGCSVIALAIFLERLAALRRSRIIPQPLLTVVEDLLLQKKISEAETLCKQDRSCFANILHVGIHSREKSRERLKESIEQVGKKEAVKLNKYIGGLGTIAHISPLLGLLGTVLGMMNVFEVITEKGVGNAQSLAGGISEALITTIAGLMVAIPTLVAFRFLNAKIKALVTEVEEHSLKMMDLIHKEG